MKSVSHLKIHVKLSKNITHTYASNVLVEELVPELEEYEPPQDPGSMHGDYLTESLALHVKTGEAVFEFRVQRQTDPVAMHV